MKESKDDEAFKDGVKSLNGANGNEDRRTKMKAKEEEL